MPVPVPLPMPLPMLIPSVDSPSQSVGHFDFEFLINIIKGLENTIALLNRRLEAYENASANVNANANANANTNVGAEVNFGKNDVGKNDENDLKK